MDERRPYLWSATGRQDASLTIRCDGQRVWTEGLEQVIYADAGRVAPASTTTSCKRIWGSKYSLRGMP